VDFEHGLNLCIQQIREALGDDATTPRYVETVPRRGYRFIADLREPPGRPASERVEPPTSAATEPPSAHTPWRRLFLTGSVGLLAVGLVAAYALRQGVWARAKAQAGSIRLVVLPFENLSGDPEQEYFSDGITEEMTDQIAHLNPQRLMVIGRTSTMTYKRRSKTIAEIGKELGVQYVLEGSVRRSGEMVRVSAKLIKVEEQTHVWGESYNRDLRDVLKLQREVTRAIAGAVQIELIPQQQARLASARPIQPAAHEAYLKGRYLWEKRTADGLGPKSWLS